jgi:hypothetical protein
MSFFPVLSGRRWLLIPLGAALFVGVTDCGRWRQVEQVTALGREEAADTSRHWLVAPEHHTRTHQWLLETELMLTTGQARIRQVPHENAPIGRAVHSASPYRWWLGILAWADHKLSGRPLAQSVEQAALWSGPLQHLLLILGSTVFATRHWGPAAAALIALGLAWLYPLGGEFQPGVADDHGLAIAAAWGSVLLLAAGLQGDRRAFVLAGVAGGTGLWLNIAIQAPVLAGIGLGALLLVVGRRRSAGSDSPASDAPLPWLTWALAGTLTSLIGYLVEYFPDHMELQLRANHPLYGAAWIGLGALLALAESWRTRSAEPRQRTFALAMIALTGLAALPLAMHLGNSAAFLAANPETNRLTNLLNGPVAPNLASWLTSDGPFLAKAALVLPLFLLVPAVLASLRHTTDAGTRRAVLFTTGPLLVCLVPACAGLRGWALAQLVLLGLLAVALPRPGLRTWLAVAACLLPGAVELALTARGRDASELSRLEAESLVERDLAHWIAVHAETPGAVVLAAPDRSPGLAFYGGLRGLGSTNWANHEGVTATVRILSATTADEAQALLNQRGVSHLVLASWDTDLDEFVRWTSANPNDAFLAALRRWALPPWLQPRAYRLPAIAGLEGQSLVVFQVTDNTDRALALSRLADYALEMEDTAMAASVNETLKGYPANLGALVGRARLEKAQGDTAAFDQVLATIQQNLSSRLDRLLPWDRRVSLAVALALGGRNELAKSQVRRCMTDLNETRLRSLSEGELYRLLVLGRSLDVPVPQPALRELALSLLPAEARDRLSPP